MSGLKQQKDKTWIAQSCAEVLVMKNDLFSYYIVEEVVLHVCATILLHHP